MEGSSAHGSVDLDSLTNFPRVIMPPKFKALEFVKYDGTGDPCVRLHMFCRKMVPYRYNHPLLCQMFPDSLTGPWPHGMRDWKRPLTGGKWPTLSWNITDSTLR